jgi:hypothetical protein
MWVARIYGMLASVVDCGLQKLSKNRASELHERWCTSRMKLPSAVVYNPKFVLSAGDRSDQIFRPKETEAGMK